MGLFRLRDNASMRKPPSAFERLYQPSQPLFWMALVLNVLATVMVLALQSGVLTPLAHWLTAGFALANNALGGWAVWRLWRSYPSGVVQARPSDEQA